MNENLENQEPLEPTLNEEQIEQSEVSETLGVVAVESAQRDTRTMAEKMGVDKGNLKRSNQQKSRELFRRMHRPVTRIEMLRSQKRRDTRDG